MKQLTGDTMVRIRAAVLALVLAAISLTWISVQADPVAAAPTLDVAVSGSEWVLIGEPVSITVEVTNSTTTPGYNTGIAVVLPSNVSFVSSPALSSTLANTPGTGQTTVWFENLNDSQPNSTETLTLDVLAGTAPYPVGDTFDVTATAYTSDDPRVVPASDGTGSTGTGTDSTTVELIAIAIEKTEPSPEGELLRGVHAHDTVYTLTVENNPTNATNAVVVDDYLPAGLEFLGCGTVDNTTDAPTFAGNNVEYAGASRLDASTADLTVNCPAPVLVETVQVDPDGAGPMVNGVYTHVQWNLGAMTTGETRLITYAAGVPIRENTLTWSGATPDAVGAQTANLDNNGGAETTDEQALRNYARVDGDYTGPLDGGGSLPVGNDDTLTVTAEDIRLLKSVGGTDIVQTTESIWTLTVNTSEYRTVDNLDITDTLPDGQCPLGPVNYDSSDPGGECDPTGANPSIAYTSVTENTDGSWTLFWDDVATLGASDSVVLTFPSRVRTYYQESSADDTPVVTSDGLTNSVTLTGDDHLIAGIPADEADGTPDVDASSASQAAFDPTIDKTVSAPAAPGATLDCNTASYIDADDLASAPFAYRPGDIVCYTLRVEVPANLTFKNALVSDFMPAGVTLQTFLGATGANDVTDFNGPFDFDDGTTAATGDDSLSFEIGTTTIGSDRYLPISTVARTWEVRFRAEFTGAPTGSGASLEKANLMKLTTQSSAGPAISLRDQATFIAVEPQLTIAKSTTASNVVGGTNAPYTVTVTNVSSAGTAPPDDEYARASDIDITDDLPAPLTCSDVVIDTVAGATESCTGSQITWTITSLDAGDAINLTYTLAVPDTIAPSQTTRYTNTATVVEFSQTNNDTGTTNYTPGTTDTAALTTATVTLAKIQQSSVDEGGNSANGSLASTAEQATIGETVAYQMSVDIPAGTTVHDANFRELLPTGTALVSGSVTATFDDDISDVTPPAALPTAGFALDGTDPVRVNFPATFTNPAGSGAARVTIDLSVTITDVVGNVAGTNIDNRARFSFAPTSGGSAQTVNSASVRTTVVEPDPTVAKTDDDADGNAAGGQVVNYTVSVTNPTASNVSTAHDLVVVDTVPDRLSAPTGISDGGIWNPTPRTITWNTATTPALASMAPGATAIDLTYTATVVDPVPVGGPIENTVVVTATSMAGTPTGERTTYTDNATNSLTVQPASLTKVLNPDTGPYTIGETVIYQLTSTIPEDTVAYDHTITDSIPDGLVYDSASTLTVGPNCTITGTTGSIFTTAVADGGTDLDVFVGDTLGLGGDCVVSVDVTTHVDGAYDGTGTPADGTAVAGGDALINSARSNWMQTNTIATPTGAGDLPGTWDGQTTPATRTVTVSEPQLVIDKDVTTVTGCDASHVADGGADDDACAIQPGDGPFTYTLTIRNSGDEPAHDLVVVDQPDAELTNVVPVTGAADVTDGWTSGDPDLRWDITGPLAPGASTALTYTADLAASGSLANGAVATNVADVTAYYGLDAAARGATPDERTYGSTFGPVTADQVDLTVQFPTLSVAKTVADGSESGEAVVGSSFQWRVGVSNGASAGTAADVDVADALPANWNYDAGTAQLCTPGCVSLGDPAVTGVAATGFQLAWTDVADLAAGATFEVRFTATPQVGALTTPGVGSTINHVNTASVTSDDASGASANATASYTGAADTANGVLYEADVRLDKEIVTTGPYLAGQTVVYRVTVTNDGPDAATGVVVDDVLDGGDLLYSATDSVDGSYDSGTGRWTLPASLANGASAVLDLRVVIDRSGIITNTAQVVEAGRHDPDSTPNNGIGSEDDQDSVSITAGTASLGSTVWFDLDGSGGDETTKGSEPAIAGVTLNLRAAGNDAIFGNADDFFGPDGVSGGGDDITTTSAVTDSNGNYAFVGLPHGTYRVEVDPSTLPSGATGWSQTFDDDASMNHRSGDIALSASTTSYVDADFSYTGAGSLGDRIWWDVDRSEDGNYDNSALPGDQDQPLAGIEVGLLWAGFDGTFGTGDDVTYPATTTDGTGGYQFTGLAAGQYRVSVDTADTDMPAGMTDQTWDVEHTSPGGGDGDPAALAEVSLAAGEDRTDVDFSFTGTASLGDKVWLDLDADGVQDSNEPGIEAVTVTLVWFGNDGVAGGGDDLTIVTETAADGSYGFENLPAGTFSVTVDSGDAGMPAAVTPTFDRDGTGTAHSAEVVVAAGDALTDVDFGYRGPGSVGDTVWLDSDADGTLNGTEVGLPGVDLDIIWAGVDGTFGNSDDETFAVTTAADGTYGLAGLPHGDYRVTVDQSTLISGLVPTSDRDATLDHTTDVTVDGATPDRLDADFGYRGTASIGDRVWGDLDGDGVVDITETGIGGVTVTVTHAGLDGIFGTADDVAIVTTTDGDGFYGAAGLPGGPVRVGLGAGVPGDHAVVFELDGELDGSWEGTLDPGAERIDVDFGLRVDADLSITKSHTAPFAVGGDGVYTIVVSNAGPATAVGVTVTDELPAGLSFISATGMACAVSGSTATSSLVTCTGDDLASGASATVQLTVAVGTEAAPGVTNLATVSAATPDRDPTNNSASDPTEVPLATLTLDKVLVGDLESGEQATYRLTVVNGGPSAAPDLTITDGLPVGTSYVSASGDQWGCAAVDRLVRCHRTASLAAGETTSVELTVAVADSATGRLTNTASVTSSVALSASSVPTDAASADVDGGEPLAYTGFPLLAATMTGLALVGAGTVLEIGSRRRRRRRSASATDVS